MFSTVLHFKIDPRIKHHECNTNLDSFQSFNSFQRFEAIGGGGEVGVAAPKHKIVVVGGGMAGSLLTRSIQNYADVTLLDPYALSLLKIFFGHYVCSIPTARQIE